MQGSFLDYKYFGRCNVDKWNNLGYNYIKKGDSYE